MKRARCTARLPDAMLALLLTADVILLAVVGRFMYALITFLVDFIPTL